MSLGTIIPIITIIISVVSLCVFISTASLTLFRRGRLAMTKPAIVFFGFDAVPRTTAKIFVRTLLYSIAARGQMIETMFAKLVHQGREQVFSFRGYGETSQLVGGSGLYVGQTGIAMNHHLVLSVHEVPYEFTVGDYVVELWVRLVRKRRAAKLYAIPISVTKEHAAVLARRDGVLFELNPKDDSYLGHVRNKDGRRNSYRHIFSNLARLAA